MLPSAAYAGRTEPNNPAMVFFNYATMQMAAKIVYYGPGLCGKTTNLRYIYEKTTPQSRGEMVSLETEADRTLFFDLLPLDVGVIGGFKTRLQLYTVPGQVFYNTTRKLVLKGVDGIVFVADSQNAMLSANAESFQNLRENLSEIGLDLDDLPIVIQLNKRDLPNIADRETIVSGLGTNGQIEVVEASAMGGTGVFETLKLISKLTLRTLRRRMMGEEGAARPPVAPKAVFQVHDTARKPSPPDTPVEEAPAAAEPEAPPPLSQPQPPSPPPPEPFPEAAAEAESWPHTEVGVAEPLETLAGLDAFPEPVDQEDDQPEPSYLSAADTGAEAMEETPVPPPPTVEEAEPPPAPAPEMKRLKVRSSIDIMAELEQLRKKATQTAAVRKRDPGEPKSQPAPFELDFPEAALTEPRRVSITVSVEDAGGNVVQQNATIDVDEATDLRTLILRLRGESSR
jgi:mutual gliding-motility protein MglA